MPRSSLFVVCLVAGAALFCAGCELPHGPLRWDQVHLDRLDILPHGKMKMPGPFCVTEDCEDRCVRDGAPPANTTHGQGPADPRAPRLMQHHHAVPLAGAGVDAPWPKFHPVPTRPVFESRCLYEPEANSPQQLPQPTPQYTPPLPQYPPQPIAPPLPQYTPPE